MVTKLLHKGKDVWCKANVAPPPTEASSLSKHSAAFNEGLHTILSCILLFVWLNYFQIPHLFIEYFQSDD